MDYEKKYKEALEVAKRKLCFDKAGMVDSFTPNDIYEMFPELKESEDERIRKWLISQLNIKSDDTNSDLNIMINKAISWLEKQKEFVSANFDDVWETADCDELTAPLEKYSKDAIKKMCHAWYDKWIELERRNWLEKQGIEKQGIRPRYNIGDVICDKSCTTLNKDAQPNMEIVDIQNGMYICDKGSFPVSQQDEYVLVGKKIDSKLNDYSVSNELRAASFAHAKKEILNPTFPNNEEFELAYTFEEGAKWNAAQKPIWSNKDKKILDELINFFVNMVLPKDHDFRIYASWLKALKDRYTWKPSDEQMEVLDDIVINGHLSNVNEKILKGLQEQLKKLK